MYEIKQLLRWLCYNELTRGLETTVEKSLSYAKKSTLLLRGVNYKGLLVTIISYENNSRLLQF